MSTVTVETSWLSQELHGRWSGLRLAGSLQARTLGRSDHSGRCDAVRAGSVSPPRSSDSTCDGDSRDEVSSGPIRHRRVQTRRGREVVFRWSGGPSDRRAWASEPTSPAAVRRGWRVLTTTPHRDHTPAITIRTPESRTCLRSCSTRRSSTRVARSPRKGSTDFVGPLNRRGRAAGWPSGTRVTCSGTAGDGTTRFGSPGGNNPRTSSSPSCPAPLCGPRVAARGDPGGLSRLRTDVPQHAVTR